RYLEIVRPEQEGGDWSLARGRIEGRLETKPVPRTATCEAMKLGAGAKEVVLACMRASTGSVPLELLQSHDGGANFSEPVPLRVEAPNAEVVSLAVSPRGTTLLAGACKPGNDGACRPTSPLMVRRESHLTVAITSAPDLGDAAIAPVFSADGRSA